MQLLSIYFLFNDVYYRIIIKCNIGKKVSKCFSVETIIFEIWIENHLEINSKNIQIIEKFTKVIIFNKLQFLKVQEKSVGKSPMKY